MDSVIVRLDSVVDWSGLLAGRARVARRRCLARAGHLARRGRGCARRRGCSMTRSTASAVPATCARRAPWPCRAASSTRPARFSSMPTPSGLPLIHRLALRIADDARAWDDPLHEDRLQFERLHREVKREIHKMHAFVRFRQIESGHVRSGRRARHVAWFEPGHHVLEAAAPFFARRFATMRWAILTPRASVDWDGHALAFGPGMRREDGPPPDAGEDLWLAYYRSIFNPARVKVAMMKKEMPVRFWKNLPEAAAVPELLAQAGRREQRMVARAAGSRRRARRRGPARPGRGGGAGLVRRARDARVARAPRRPLSRLSRRRRCHADRVRRGRAPGPRDARRRATRRPRRPARPPVPGPGGSTGARRDRPSSAGLPRRCTSPTPSSTSTTSCAASAASTRRRASRRPWPACTGWSPRSRRCSRAPSWRWAPPRRAACWGRTVSVTEHEGQWLARADGVPVLVCLHPAAILRADPQRQDALRARWIDSLAQATPGRVRLSPTRAADSRL